MKIKTNKEVRRYLTMFLSLLLSAILFNLLILKANIVCGGVNGIAIIINHIYKIKPSIIIFIISVLLLIFSLFFLGLKRTSGTIIATITYPILVEVTSYLTQYIKIDISDLFLISIFIGVIGGLSNGLMYKTGFSNGGLPIISQILYEKLKFPISKTSFSINGVIVLIGGFYFGWNMVMYAIIILYINSLMIDKIMLGTSNNKAFYIITKKQEEIKRYIINGLNHSVTIFNVEGGFEERKNKVLLTVIPTREYFLLTEGIKELDPDTFFLVCDAYEVRGGK
jgi:yitT family protein